MYGNGLIKKSELIGKNINDIEQVNFVEIDRIKRTFAMDMASHRMLTNFNATYMEFLDQWDKYRGFYNFILLVLFVFGLLMLIFGIYAIFNVPEVLVVFLFLIPSLLLCIILYLMFQQLLKIYNTYIYFPIHFNRKTRQVYVLGTDKQFRIFEWEQLRVGIFNRVDNRQQIVLLDIAEDGTVRYDFALPFDANIKYQEALLLGHWEFVRRYMDGNVKECFQAIKEYYPAFGRKETLKENLYHSIFLDVYDNDPEPIIDTINTWAITIPLSSWDFIGRIFNTILNKVPFFPAEIEAKCQVAEDDLLDIKQSDIPTQMELNLSFGQKIGVAIRLSLGLILAIFVIEMISATRGDSLFGLL